jgi:CBS domain containing-hemolysin-like protein
VLETGGGLLALLVLVLLNGFFVASEFALVTVRRTRVEQLADAGRPGARSLRDAVEHLDSYIAACQLGITIASLALGWVGEPALAGLIEPLFGEGGAHAIGVAIAFAVITAMHVIAGELAPKGIALQYAERVSLVIVGPLRAFRAIFRPAIWLLNESGWLLMRLVGVGRHSEGASHVGGEELALLVRASAEAGALEVEERFLLERVLRFSGLTVASVMVPRTEVVGLAAGAPVAEARQMVHEHRYSRYPVYRDSLDDVVGVLHVKDLMAAAEDAALEDLVRQPLVVPAQVGVNELLRLMRARRVQFGVAVDEYGGTDGIVTLEDVLEEIVGELEDEFERPQRSVPIARDAVRLDGLDSVDVLADRLGISVEEGPYKTVAGYVLERLGRIPRVGDTVEVGGQRLAVVAMDGLRIAELEARPVAPVPARPGSPAGGSAAAGPAAEADEADRPPQG